MVHACDMRSVLGHQKVEGVYETQVPLDFKIITEWRVYMKLRIHGKSLSNGSA